MRCVQHPLEEEFTFGTAVVQILQGDIVRPGVQVHFLVSTDDNYLTMGSGVSGLLRRIAGPAYVHEAQSQCPVKAGTVVDTASYGLAEHLPDLRRVLHGTVIDYDTEDKPLEELVFQTTLDCLLKAEELAGAARLEGAAILFPALATGSGKLSMEECARQMCSAIKAYLAEERLLKRIYIILFLPDPDGENVKPATLKQCEVINQHFIREANLVLDLPYNPAQGTRQIRDVYERESELRRLLDVISGKVSGKKHAIILGGPRIGKSVLLELLAQRVRDDRDSSDGKRLATVTFGRIHENTPAAFIYQKFLGALGEIEEDAGVRQEIKKAYADLAAYADPDAQDRQEVKEADPDSASHSHSDAVHDRASPECRRFLDFLKHHPERYGELVLLVDNMPILLGMESEKRPASARAFWSDLDCLEEHVRFVCTARDDIQYQRLLDRLSGRFRDGLEVVNLGCLPTEDRERWIGQLFRRFLRRDATRIEQRFVAEEAGYHPYLVSLAGYALIEAIKSHAIREPERHPSEYTPESLESFFRQARLTIDSPRREFFEMLMEPLERAERVELHVLSRAVAIERELLELRQDLEKQDRRTERRLRELADVQGHRDYLHQETLRRLASNGYLVSGDASHPVGPMTAQFMSEPFWRHTEDFFRTRGWQQTLGQPEDLVISLLSAYREPSIAGVSAGLGGEASAERADRELEMIRTMFRGRGARVVSAWKPLSTEMRTRFMASFHQCLSHQLHPNLYPSPGIFRDLKDVGNHILAQFTSIEIKQHLQRLLQGSTVLLMLDDPLKDIPWELMLETAYTGEIPFRVGRVIVGKGQPQLAIERAPEASKLRALLIGDPTGDLPIARREVAFVSRALRQDDRFAPPDLLVGPAECQQMRVLSYLESGGYTLIHYSGHTRFEGERSAWCLADGDITTDLLTNALQLSPPALVFSSSCESAATSEAHPVVYENQTFDLPSAFLQAGVEAYIGTLWPVLQEPAWQFVKEFYSALLHGDIELGECLRRAKWACRREGRWQDRIHWLAFVLYGNPNTRPSELFLSLAQEE